MSFLSNSRVTAGGVIAVLAGGLCVATAPAAQASSGPTMSAYGGSSYSSSASVGTVARSGASGYQVMCTTTAPYGQDNRSAGVHLPGNVGDLGAADNRTSTYVSGGVRTASASSTTADVRLLEAALPNISADLIHADSVVSLAHQQEQVDGTFTSNASTTLTNVTIAGEAQPVHPAPNTVVDLSSLGVKITLNQQGTIMSGALRGQYVNALVVSLAANNQLGLPAGSIVVGHSIATLSDRIFRLAYGTSFAIDAHVGTTGVVGRTAPVYLPCGGTGSVTLQNTTASVTVPGVASIGATDDEGLSTDATASTTARTVSKLANVNLLSGRVTVGAVTAESTVTRTPYGLYRSADGTSVTGVKIDGVSIANPTLHASRTVSGLGTLYFGRVTNSGPGTNVVGVQLVLSVDVGSAPKGTVIDVASATAGVAYPSS